LKLNKLPLPTIIVDTREKKPWKFAWAISHGQIAGTILDKVDAGDYTIKEVPNLIAVERKQDVSELYGNLVGTEKYERFIREMERLKQFKYRFIVVEDHWESLWSPSAFKFASRNKKWAGYMVMSHLFNIMADYGVHILFAGDKAEQLTLKLLVKHYERAFKESENA
jgi:ERCC4-type nuclease